MKRILIIFGIALFVVVAVPALTFFLLQRPIASLSGNEPVAGLEESVSVIFDNHAVPYIESRTDNDAYTAQGYITARERMFQMDMMRRSASGQTAEVFGASLLPADRFMRTLSVKQVAYAEFDRLSPGARAALKAYANGVNAYLSANKEHLSVEFTLLGYTPRTWRPEDSLVILKYLAYKLDESWRLDDFRQRVTDTAGEKVCTELFADDLVPYGNPPAPKPTAKDGKKSTGTPAQPTKNKTDSRPASISQSPLPAHSALLAELDAVSKKLRAVDNPNPLRGSTAWAVPSAASKSGGALLACNKDGEFTMPSEWFLCSMNSPGLHAAGASIPGVPGIIVGRNENVAWGSASLKADVQDIYLEQFKSQFDASYNSADGWHEAEVRIETIPVRFGSEVEHRVFSTNHGPVLLRNQQSAVSLAWTGLINDKSSFDSLYKINHATSIEDFTTALQNYGFSPQMYVVADRFGNTAYQAAGMIPIRTGGATGTMLNLGWEKKGTWQSIVPFEKLPRAVVQATTRTPIVAANQKPSGGDYALPQADPKLMLGHQWVPPYRANRLLSAISGATAPLTLADAITLTGDNYSQLAPVVSKALQESALQTQLVDRNGLRSIEMLLKWDGQLRPDKSEGSVYESFLQTLARRVVEPRIGRDMTNEYMQRWPMWLTLCQYVLQSKPEPYLAPDERTYSCFFVTTLVQAMKSLRISLDTSDPNLWSWGKLHQVMFNQVGAAQSAWFAPFFRVGPVPVGGAGECINSCSVATDPSELSFAAQSGPTQRMIVDMSDRDKFYQSIGTGQSEHLMSPYRTDLMQSWLAVDLVPIAFSPDQVVRQARHRLILDKD